MLDPIIQHYADALYLRATLRLPPRPVAVAACLAPEPPRRSTPVAGTGAARIVGMLRSMAIASWHLLPSCRGATTPLDRSGPPSMAQTPPR